MLARGTGSVYIIIIIASSFLVSRVVALEAHPDTDFAVVSERTEILQLLERAHSRHVAVLNDLHTCKGEGEIEQLSIVPELVSKGRVRKLSEDNGAADGASETDDEGNTRIKGPFSVHRKSKSQFVWSSDMRSLRSTYERIEPILFESVNDGRRFSVTDDLNVRNLVRPDGYYYFRPNIRAGEFKGYPPSLSGGQRTRIVERLPLEQAEERSRSSTVFDPSTLLLVGGLRIDALSSSYLQKINRPGLAPLLKKAPDGSLLVTETYRNSAGHGTPTLSVTVLLDASIDYLPKEAFFVNADGITIETMSWSYAKQHPVTFPSIVEDKKFDSRGENTQSRTVRLSNLVINEGVAVSDFSFGSIGVEDGDRIIDRIEKNVAFMSGGEAVPVLASKWSTTKWCLVVTNLAALLCIIAVLFSRVRRRVRVRPAHG